MKLPRAVAADAANSPSPTTAWSSVSTTQLQVAADSTRPAPNRSASAPAGTMLSAYPSRNALKTRPIATWSSPKSLIKSAPAVETFTRQR